MFPWLLCAGFAALALALAVKVRLLHGAMDEISRELGERLSTDTNVLISLSSRDAHARRLAADLNRELRLLRRERLRYLGGNMELKNAVTNISHDLRTPLTAISGYLELLEREDVSAGAARYLDVIRDRTEFMTGLAEELFHCSVVTAPENGPRREEVDLGAALEESLAAFYTELRSRGIEPETVMPEARVVRRLDRRMLARVLSNLLSNAARYSGGDLRVELTGDGVITFSNLAPGLDGVDVGRLFDRFYTVETARRSTGLGLSIARTLTAGMGGSIAAEFENGRLTVRLSFPEI